MSAHEVWRSPLEGRYASREMLELYSAQSRHSTWRQMWIWLAEGEKSLGLEISDKAIEQMKSHVQLTPEDFEIAAVEEKRRRHDVMAHVHAFGQVAPEAAGIIHLGATSCFVTDGAEQIMQRKALDLLIPKLARVIRKLADFAMQYKDLPCLAYTHGQAAQPITVGKRACQWIEDLLMDLEDFERAKGDIKFRGCKGTTGSQASYLALFNGDHEKVKQLDKYVTKAAGFEKSCTITSQTYSRKQDLRMANVFSSFGATCERIGGDIRHLAMTKEMEEPFEKDQIGSSAMAYKRNPMRSERMCSLGRMLRTDSVAASNTYSAQWLERSLDDSAARRLYLPEMNILADALLNILDNVSSGLVVYPAIIGKRLKEEIGFMSTENIIMAIHAKGASRQDTHEQIRVHSHAATLAFKTEGKDNDLIERVSADPFFASILPDMAALTDPNTFVGRCPQLVEEFAGPGGEVEAALSKYQSFLEQSSGKGVELKV